MNCPEFEACLRDVAAEGDRKNFRRAEALEHANGCSRCAARLSEERALVAGLQVLAGAVRHETGPAHLEETLLRSFRRLELTKEAEPASPLGVQPPETARWRTPGYVGLAASVLLLLGWGLIQFTWGPGMDQAQISPGPKSVAPLPEKQAALATVTPESSSELAQKPSRLARARPPRISTPVAEGGIQYARRSSGDTVSREAESTGNDRVETEFFPFMAAGPVSPSEQRQFVRVKLPRSALQVFGLPMNMERAREPVQADVMLGEDGRALAVRFVREK